MHKLRYMTRLLREYLAFARQNKAYWLIPMLFLLGLAALLVVASQAAVPFVYTLF